MCAKVWSKKKHKHDLRKRKYIFLPFLSIEKSKFAFSVLKMECNCINSFHSCVNIEKFLYSIFSLFLSPFNFLTSQLKFQKFSTKTIHKNVLPTTTCVVCVMDRVQRFDNDFFFFFFERYYEFLLELIFIF